MLKGLTSVAAIGVLVLAGCGGGSSSTSSTAGASGTQQTPVQTKAQFISQADAICRRAKGQLRPQQKKLTAAIHAEQVNDTPVARSALSNALRRDAALATPQLDQLRGLTPPPEDRVVISKYLAGISSQVDLIGQFATAIDNNDAAASKSISAQITSGANAVRGLAQGYGFKVCGSSGR